MPELWPFKPLMGFAETLEWYTDVLSGRTGEQRIALRSAPRQFFAYSFILDNRQFMWVKAFSRTNGAVAIDIPVWPEKSTFGFVDQAATVFNVDTRYADYRVGSKVVLWESWERNAVGTIQSMTDSSITLVDPIGIDLENASIMPVREAFFNGGMQINRAALHAMATAKFQVVDNVDLNVSSVSYPTYQSLSVLTDSPHDRAQISENIVRTSEYIDNGFGPVAIETVRNYADFGQTISFIDNLGEELWSRREWLHFLRGKQHAFWLPSFNMDLELSTGFTSVTTDITIKTIGSTGFYLNKHVMFLLKNGNRYFREIVNAVEVDSDFDTLTISSALGEAVDLDDVVFISFLSKVRLNSDSIDIDYRTLGKTSMVIPVIEVPE